MRLANQFIEGQTEVLKPETCKVFHTNFTKGLEEDRSAAWKLASSKESSAGPDLPPESYGHAGFTGTSCWVDPTRDLFVILLTNRVDPTRNTTRVFALRRDIADAVQKSIVDAPLIDWESGNK